MLASAETAAATTAADPERKVKERRHSKNHKSDPFWSLPDDALKLPDQPSPSTNEDDHADHWDSLITDLIVTPLNVVSFLLSLFIVERQQRQWRMSQHAQHQEASAWSQFGFKNPEPYQESTKTTWHPRLSWKRRGVAKSALADSFDLKGRVVVALVAWTLIGCTALVYAFRRMYQWALP